MMDNIDWLLLGLVAIAALAQLYFGERYREIFLVDKATINKTYVSMIRDLLDKHPSAGRLYVGLVSIQVVAIIALIVKSKLA
ncbi:hypothetical protein AB6Q56_13055 [Dechloromonas sp. ARDL1]|uniref:hypothetical protein n=1 Tax=Dechloromonas sp. ARDL1 TaxID=3322121 RepID=UPI003DA71DDD